MKKFVMILLMFLALPALALEPCKSGSYYNPETSGTGIDLQVSEDLIVIYRYGYLGSDSDYWVGVTDNDDSGEWIFEVTQTFGYNGADQAVVGDIILTDLGDGRLNLEWSYSVDLDQVNDGQAIPWCLGELCNGSEDLIPLFLPHNCQ